MEQGLAWGSLTGPWWRWAGRALGHTEPWNRVCSPCPANGCSTTDSAGSSDNPQPLESTEQYLVSFIFCHGRSCVCWDCCKRGQSSYLQESVALCAYGKVKSASRGVHGKRALAFPASLAKDRMGRNNRTCGPGGSGAQPQLRVLPQLWGLSLALPKQRLHHSWSTAQGPAPAAPPAAFPAPACLLPLLLLLLITHGFFSQLPLRLGHQFQQHE